MLKFKIFWNLKNALKQKTEKKTEKGKQTNRKKKKRRKSKKTDKTRTGTDEITQKGKTAQMGRGPLGPACVRGVLSPAK